ncbi:MAG: hypothetical protein JKX76_02445 [Colwellia sp.]|nr:hypothetical protein [Colwellia sp.]
MNIETNKILEYQFDEDLFWTNVEQQESKQSLDDHRTVSPLETVRGSQRNKDLILEPQKSRRIKKSMRKKMWNIPGIKSFIKSRRKSLPSRLDHHNLKMGLSGSKYLFQITNETIFEPIESFLLCIDWCVSNNIDPSQESIEYIIKTENTQLIAWCQMNGFNN